MQNINSNLYAFVLGREQKLAQAELEAVLKQFCFCFSDLRITGNVVFAKMDNFGDDEAQLLMNNLAGTVKIFRITNYELGIKENKGSVPGKIRDDIVELLDNCMKNRTNKVNFGISDFTRSMNRDRINRLGIEAKIELKKAGHKVRFVATTEGNELSTIQSLKNKLDTDGVEVGIFSEGIGKLISLNNPEDWGKIDYGKPAADKYSGMIPPKLARVMINLALASLIQNSKFKIQNCKSKLKIDGLNENCPPASLEAKLLRAGKLKIENCDAVILDPFCGSGNILIEGLRLGFDVIGSDVSPKAVEDSKTNVEWLLDQIQNLKVKSQNCNPKFKIFQADATSEEYINSLNTQFSSFNTHKNCVFVAEPFLGQPKKFMPSLNAVRGEYSKIKDLYLSFLGNLSHLRTKDFCLCLVFPLVETTDHAQFSLYGECVDEIKKMGYTQVRPQLIYGRDYQVVKREIILLHLKQKETIYKKQ